MKRVVRSIECTDSLINQPIDREAIIKQVCNGYKQAALDGTDRAWKRYRKMLEKLAVEADAASPEALEDWALNYGK